MSDKKPAPVLRKFDVDVYDDGTRDRFSTVKVEAHDFDESPFGSLTFIRAVPYEGIFLKLVEVFYAAGEVRSFRETTSYEPPLISLIH